MAKTLTIRFGGEEYTLEYTRESVEMMERQGFRAKDISEKPMNSLPKLFAGAFIAHHRRVKQKTIDEIFDSLGDKMGLIEKLGEMYAEPIEALFDDPADSGKNASWDANF